MSQPSIHDVDAAVRSVLFGRGGRPEGADRAAEVFAGRLLSLRHVEGLGGGVREVRIAPGTVVTPLARDFLKRQRIELRLASRALVGRDPGEWGFVMEAESGIVAALRRDLLGEARPWVELGTSAGSALAWVAGAPARGALLLTDEASVAVWRACRRGGVRASVAADVDAVDRAIRRLGVNLLVVEPSGKSISLMKQMGRTFQLAGAPRLPEELAGEDAPCGLPR